MYCSTYYFKSIIKVCQRFKDEAVHKKFKNVGKAAQRLGNNIADVFKEEVKGKK